MQLLRVGLEMLLPGEAQAARLTPEGFHGPVGHDVQLELVQAVELPAAAHVLPERTLEPLHQAVTLHVTLQLVPPVETLVALVTRERQLTCMDEPMRFQIVLVAQPFAAYVASERALAVRCREVLAQKTLRGKVAIAQPARIAMPIRFPVISQRVSASVFSAAFLAFEGRPPLPRLPIRQVGVLMQIQIVEIREAIRTDVTAVRQLIAVAAYMIDKFSGKFEEAAAAGDSAAVAFLAQVGAQVGAVHGVLAEPLRAEPTVVEALKGQRAILAKEQHTIVQFGGLWSREAVRGKFIGLRRII